MNRNGTASYSIEDQLAALKPRERKAARAELAQLAKAKVCRCEWPHVYEDDDGDLRCFTCAKAVR